MSRIKIPAVYIRGGSSKGIFFHCRDLPPSTAERNAIFLEVLGSPDPYQRQLNGLGGGISSLSKAVVVTASKRPDADIDYTFAQVAVDKPSVDYSAACGNLSSAIGPFAVDEGLISATDGELCVRVYITNTNKIYRARFIVKDGMTVEEGHFEIPGVAGTGAKITLDYLDPGGAATHGLLPSNAVRDTIQVGGVGLIEVSLVDATNPLVLVAASDLGLTATEHPSTIEADQTLMRQLDLIRRIGGVLMGMSKHPEDIGLANPKIAMIGPPSTFRAIDGKYYVPADHDIAVRMVSMERIHRAITLTGAMCIGTAARIEGTIPHAFAVERMPLRIGNPSGILPVEAEVSQQKDGAWNVKSATVYRTQRRLMEGAVLVSGNFMASPATDGSVVCCVK